MVESERETGKRPERKMQGIKDIFFCCWKKRQRDDTGMEKKEYEYILNKVLCVQRGLFAYRVTI